MPIYSAKAVVFDLDGTIADTLDDLKNSVNYAIGLLGLAPCDRNTICGRVGSGAANLIRKSLPPEADEETVKKTLSEFYGHYMSHALDGTKPFPGVLELLNALKERGYRLAVVSNKPDAGTKAIVSALFGDIFDYVSGEKSGIPRKPEPDMVRFALDALGTEEAVYVGDSEVDVKTAANSGLPCVCVTWGFRSAEQLKEAGGEVFISDPSELLEMLGK